MSSSNGLENNQINDNNENDNLIKQFSRNFTKNFQALKLSNKANKNDDESPPKKIKKKEVSEQTKLSNKSLLNQICMQSKTYPSNLLYLILLSRTLMN